MTLTELRYIVAVAKEKQFCKAAKACYVSQPTLSLGIKKLEDELGVVLFERKHQELVITPVGQKIVAQAERALKQLTQKRGHMSRGDRGLIKGSVYPHTRAAWEALPLRFWARALL